MNATGCSGGSLDALFAEVIGATLEHLSGGSHGLVEYDVEAGLGKRASSAQQDSDLRLA